jgi:hypothetical protein
VTLHGDDSSLALKKIAALVFYSQMKKSVEEEGAVLSS